jgi:RNA polymerase sigma-70 factor (ECF subfamily)
VQETGQHLDWCGKLFEEQAANLILYGRSFGLGHSEAEDMVQEVFAALIQLPQPPERPAHYAVRALRNRALNFKRSFLRRVLRELESSRWFEPCDTESPGERQAMACLETLPQDQREVIVLKVWHGHTFEEIGELTGCSQNTAAGRYRYGLQKLRQCLNESVYDAEEFFGTTDGVLDSPSSVLRS